MGLYEIKDLGELLQFLPKLVKLFDAGKLDALWRDSIQKEQFVADLTNNSNNLKFFGLLDEKGDVKYFFAVTAFTVGDVWLFYVALEHRAHTKSLFALLRDYLKDLGLVEFRFNTRKLTSSYDRWISKLGAQKFQVVYQINLK